MFEKSGISFDARLDGMPDCTKNGIMKHLLTSKSEFEGYFLKTIDKDPGLCRIFFRYSFKKLADECQDYFLEFINDSTAQQEYEKTFATILDRDKRVLTQNNKKSSSHSYILFVDLSTYASRDFLFCC